MADISAGNSGLGNFAGAFAQAFGGIMQQKRQNDIIQKEMDMKTKLFGIQLQKEQLGLTGATQQFGARQTLANNVQGKPQGLLDLLTDPNNTQLLLQSGLIEPDKLASIIQTKNQQDRMYPLLQGALGSAGIGPGAPGTPGLAPAAPGMSGAIPGGPSSLPGGAAAPLSGMPGPPALGLSPQASIPGTGAPSGSNQT